MRLLILMAAAALLPSCSRPSVGEAVRAMRSDAYARSFVAGQFRVEARLVPEALFYMTFHPVDTSRPFSRSLLDSVKSVSRTPYGLTFALTLSPRSDTLRPNDYSNDVVYGQVDGMEAYRRLLDSFHQGMGTLVWLEAEGRKHELRHSQMANSWGMSKGRTFMLVFDPLDRIFPGKAGKVSLVVETIVPGQGRNSLAWDLPIGKHDFI